MGRNGKKKFVIRGIEKQKKKKAKMKKKISPTQSVGGDSQEEPRTQSKSYKAKSTPNIQAEKSKASKGKPKAKKEEARRAAVTKDRIAAAKDGQDKERIHDEGDLSETAALPKRNRDSVEEKSRPHFTPGVYSKRFLREQEEKGKMVNSYQDRHLAKSGDLPNVADTNPRATKDHIRSLFKKSNPKDRTYFPPT